MGSKFVRQLVILVVTASLTASVVHSAGAKALRPSNDNAADATLVSELPFHESLNLSRSTLEASEAQPSCRPVRGTVWYAFVAGEDENLVAEASSVNRTAVAIFRSTDLGLEEIACDGGSASPQAEFRAVAGNSYFVQLGAAARNSGFVDFSLYSSKWQESTLYSYEETLESEERNVQALEVHGRPSPADPNKYTVWMRISDQQPVSYTVDTFGLVTKPIDISLIRTEASSTTARFAISGRYDSSQGTCQLNDDTNNSCLVRRPLSDLGWLTDGEGSRAELVVTLSVIRNGQIVAERSLAVPYAGQLAGLRP